MKYSFCCFGKFSFKATKAICHASMMLEAVSKQNSQLPISPQATHSTPTDPMERGLLVSIRAGLEKLVLEGKSNGTKYQQQRSVCVYSDFFL